MKQESQPKFNINPSSTTESAIATPQNQTSKSSIAGGLFDQSLDYLNSSRDKSGNFNDRMGIDNMFLPENKPWSDDEKNPIKEELEFDSSSNS